MTPSREISMLIKRAYACIYAAKYNVKSSYSFAIHGEKILCRWQPAAQLLSQLFL